VKTGKTGRGKFLIKSNGENKSILRAILLSKYMVNKFYLKIRQENKHSV
jgi:hypothetical protein